MVKDDIKRDYKLKVPSAMEVITPENMWLFNKYALPKLPDTFENTHIAEIEEFSIKNDNLLSRLLSYLKYLEIVSEERVKRTEYDEIISTQQFHLTEKGKKLKRSAIIDPDNLYKTWRQVLIDSELYKAIVTSDDFKQYNKIPKITIRKLIMDSFSKKVKNVSDRVEEAEKYLIHLFEQNELFKFDGDYFIPVNNQLKKKQQKRQPDPTHTEATEGNLNHTNNNIENNFTNENDKDFYTIITDDYELKVRYDSFTIELLKSQLDIILKKINHMNGVENDDDESFNSYDDGNL